MHGAEFFLFLFFFLFQHIYFPRQWVFIGRKHPTRYRTNNMYVVVINTKLQVII